MTRILDCALVQHAQFRRFSACTWNSGWAVFIANNQITESCAQYPKQGEEAGKLVQYVFAKIE